MEKPRLVLELALLAGTETRQETIEPDRLQFFRLPADKCRKLTSRKIESYCQEANRSQSLYTCTSKKKWLRTVIQLDKRLRVFKRKLDLEIHSNVLPRQAYLKILERVMAICLGNQCSGGFFPVSVLSDRNTPSQSCRDCALVKQLRIEADVVVDELDNLLEPLELVEKDVKLGKLIYGGGADGVVSKIFWCNGTFVRKRFHESSTFLRELEVASRVSHPNIVHCFGRSCIDSADYDLFMEFLEEDLESFLNERVRPEGSESPFSFRDKLDVLLQIAEAMRHIHEKNFVHGDLKPGNILVSKLAMPHSDVQFYLMKVADFGRTQRIDSSGTIVGTFDHRIGSRGYTAPEVLRCRENSEGATPEHPQKIDVYSFGVVAYQVLSGLTTSRLYVDFSRPGSGSRGVMKPDTDGLQWRPNRIWNENSGTWERVCLEPDRSLLLPLIERCWASSPEARPTFPEICCEIKDLY